jgi:hypothetical protein
VRGGAVTGARQRNERVHLERGRWDVSAQHPDENGGRAREEVLGVGSKIAKGIESQRDL